MSYQVENVDAITRRIRFQVPAERVNSELSQAYNNLRTRVRLPGFRPGKIPRKVLEMRFGKQVKAEVTGKLIQQGWDEVRPELEALGQPAVEQDGIEPRADFEFSLVVEVKPELELGAYKGIEVPFPPIEVPPEAIQVGVERRLEGAARIVEITDPHHAIDEGDIVITELVLADGEEELVREAGTSIKVGDERYYPGADSLLLGLHRGEDASGKVTIGEDTQLEDLAGRELDATVKAVSIQASRAPELSDEVAAELGFEGGVGGMRAAISEQIREPMEQQARQMARQALLSKLVEGHEVQAPKAMVGQQLEMLVMERRVMHQYSGGKPGTLDLGAEVMEQLTERAAYAVKAGLLLEAVGEAEGVELQEQDLEDAYQRIADERGQRVEAIKGYLQQEEGAVDTLRSRLLEEKVLDWLFEQATLVEPPPMPDLTDMVKAAGELEREAAASGQAEAEPAAEAPSWKPSMKKGELLDIAEGMGLDVNTKNTKAQIIAALEGAGG